MSEQEERQRVVQVARSWIATPYHHMAMVKGVGVDCAMLVIAVFREAGVVSPEDVQPYSPQWFLNRGEEKYLHEIRKYAHETTDPKPGDIAVYKIGRLFAHGAIIVDPGWPVIVHALSQARAVIEDRGDGGTLAGKEHLFFTRW